ncbi:unnamed protein product [Alternaria alternata]
MTSGTKTKLRNRMLRDFVIHMQILKFCSGVIKDYNHEGPLMDSVLEVARQCTDIGAKLSEKESTIKKRRISVLASWDILQFYHEDFVASVSLLHQLVQSLMSQETQREVMKLSLVRFAYMEQLAQDSLFRVDDLQKLMMTSHASPPSYSKGKSFNQPGGQRVQQDWESTVTRESYFTVGPQSIAEVMTLAEEVVAKSVARGVHFDPDPSLVLGTVVIVHETQPRFVPVRAKYDTGSDANFVPYELVRKNGLSDFLKKLETTSPEDNVFLGLNNQEYIIDHTIELQWSAATMRHVRTTQFHVAEGLPYDVVLGNPFIQENQVFHPERVALPLHHKLGTSAERKEEKARLEAQQKAACEEQLRARTEAARKRALEKEALKLAKQQTSAQASADRLRMNNMSIGSFSGSTTVPGNVVVESSSASSAVTLAQITTGTVTPFAGSSVLTSNWYANRSQMNHFQKGQSTSITFKKKKKKKKKEKKK